MIKKIFIFLGALIILAFTSCGGGGSSKEAKALLQKILQFAGIPQEIVVNVCQDSNRDGICGGGEIFANVIINKGDDINDILRKISLTPDGKYFLETYNPELPILVELQDEAKVNFDNGKFTLNFDGFKTNEDNETKEISILESMVDADALTKEVADKFRTLNNTEAQDKYYKALLDSLETNINTLQANNLDSKTAVTATIKEMGDETKTNQEQADKINNCGNDQSCIDKEIKKVSDELIITEEEVVEIKDKENNPTPTPTPIANGGEEVVYGKWVKPSRSVCDGNGGKYDNDCLATWENAKSICSASGDVLPNIETLGAVITDCGGDWISWYNDNNDNYEERRDKNIANESYQACYKEKGFTSYYYWSSTTTASDSSNAWYVHVYDGFDYRVDKSNEYFVRCVRGGQ